MFKNDPITVRRLSKARDAWMYRNRRSLDVVVEVTDGAGEYVATAQVRITRQQIDAWIAEADKS